MEILGHCSLTYYEEQRSVTKATRDRCKLYYTNFPRNYATSDWRDAVDVTLNSANNFSCNGFTAAISRLVSVSVNSLNHLHNCDDFRQKILRFLRGPSRNKPHV